MMDSSSCCSSFRDSSLLPGQQQQQAHHPNSHSFLVRLYHFLDLYEDGADPSGIHCQTLLHSAIGAAALKNHTTITDLLLQQTSHPDHRKNSQELPIAEEDSRRFLTTEGVPEIESSPLDTEVGHSTKDYSNYVVLEQSEIERIEADVRGRKLQEQKRAVKMANQLHQAFSVWQQDARETGIEATCSGEYHKYGNVAIEDEALVESSFSRNSLDSMDCMTLCQFLVDLELGKLEDKNLHGAWQSKEVASSSPDLAAITDIGNGHTTSSTSIQRSFSIENAMDDVAYHKLRQKLSYLLEFRGKLDEESWRVGVDVGLIFSYFKVLLEFLMNQITESATHLADVKHQLMSNQECLQTTKSSLAVSQAEFHALHDQTDVFRSELEGQLEKDVAEVGRLRKELELVTWEQAAEFLVYSEVVDGMSERWSNLITSTQEANMETLRKAHAAESLNEASLSCLRKQLEANVKTMTEKLEDKWEHDVESSIYVELLNETALAHSQESKYSKEKERRFEERLKIAVTEVERLTRELEDLAWEQKLESCISLEIFDDITLQYSQEIKQLSAELNVEEAQKERLLKKVEELNKKVNELEYSSWKSTAESSIYFAVLDDITSNLTEEIEHLRAERSNECTSSGKLQVLYVEVERSMKELERTSIGEKTESSIRLDIIDTVAQGWALEVNRAISEFRRNEGALEGILEQKDMEIKRLTEELEFILWEHEVESSIYLEVVGERACEWRQVIDSLAGDFNKKQIVRRKELQASCSFSGRTQKENLASEDASPLVQGDFEFLKSALRKSPLSDQSVSSPGKATDPIYVVVRRNTQAAVEGFMVDIGESPSKRTNKEVVGSLKLEVLDLRREKEQLIEHYTDELHKLKFEFGKEFERMKVELEQERQNEVARLRENLESQHRKEAEQIKDELNQRFQIQFADLQKELEFEYSNRIAETIVAVEQKHRDKIVDLQRTLELEHRMELERVTIELQQKHENDLVILQRNLDHEATKKGEWKSMELEQKFQNEIAIWEEKLVNVKRKLEHGLQGKKRQQCNVDGAGNVSPEISNLSKSSDICFETKGSISDFLIQFESAVVTLVAERDELCDRVSKMELLISELQEKVSKLEGERSWLEERVPGLEKKLATEQSRLEDMVAGHAFERDQLKLIVSSHKNEQTKLERELAERKAERNYLATTIAMLALACRNLKVSNQNERERWRSAYMMALKDMERTLNRTQKQVKEERAQKGSAESDAQRMKAEIFTMQQESKDVWRLLEKIIAEHINRAVGTSQQVEFGLCRKIHQQSMRFEAVQQQVNRLLQALRQPQMSKMDYLHTIENLLRAEQEVDVLGDEVDSLVDLLEKVHIMLAQYAPVLLHYPGVAEVAKLVECELFQRNVFPTVPT